MRPAPPQSGGGTWTDRVGRAGGSRRGGRLRRGVRRRPDRQHIQRRKRNALRRLGALCAALALSLAGALAQFTGGAEGAVLGMHGATLLSDSAGGYVQVAVASFALSSALTLACVHLRGQGRRSDSIFQVDIPLAPPQEEPDESLRRYHDETNAMDPFTGPRHDAGAVRGRGRGDDRK